MQIKHAELTDCEQTVMKCIWDADEPVTCASIIRELNEKYGLDYKDTTVYTFLKTLKEKKFVESERRGVTYYTAIKEEEQYRREILNKTKRFWFSDSSAQLISTLIHAEDLSNEEREKIKKLIQELD